MTKSMTIEFNPSIIFETPCEIPMLSLTTFGISAKPNTTNPIGQFGTGLKYAIAIALRLKAHVTIVTGGRAHQFYAKSQDFRETDVQLVHMKSRK